MAGTTRNGIAYRRRPSAPPIFEPESSLWPTPVADGDRATIYKQGGIPLGVAVRRSLWPTPNARDYKGSPGAGARARGGHQSSLPATIKEFEGDGSLNPTWVEWLMGCPIGWTDSELSATALSLRSRSSSAGGSSTTKKDG
jgi:hypothetical protein